MATATASEVLTVRLRAAAMARAAARNAPVIRLTRT
jgi:hypothetical protein